MSKVSKPEFVARVSERAKLTPYKTRQVIDIVFSEIRNIVAEGNSITFNMIGKFFSGILSPTRKYNPQSGKVEKIPERSTPKFIVSKKWRRYFDDISKG